MTNVADLKNEVERIITERKIERGFKFTAPSLHFYMTILRCFYFGVTYKKTKQLLQDS